MNKLKLLVIHCTATNAGMYVTGDMIRAWHTAPVEKGGRGWNQVGYSDLIRLDGTVEALVKHDEDPYVQGWEVTNGVKGHNANSRHVVYAGGVDYHGKPSDTRNEAQIKALTNYVLHCIYLHPSIKICGHTQLDPGKACPSFDVPTYLRSIGVAEKNILAA